MMRLSDSMDAKIQQLNAVLGAAPVVPVLTVEDARQAVPLARALVAGGLPAIEVTLRTPAALEAIRAIKGEVEGALVGAGTVLDAAQLEVAADLGCAFAVSPGASPGLLDAADLSTLPLLPGVATAGEAMTLMERGYRLLKFFPAKPAGGPGFLKALAAPLPALRFCPTGGIDGASAPAYLALPNVICVGGGWLAPAAAVAANAWDEIGTLARTAAALRGCGD